jgi:hypothetical protein
MHPTGSGLTRRLPVDRAMGPAAAADTVPRETLRAAISSQDSTLRRVMASFSPTVTRVYIQSIISSRLHNVNANNHRLFNGLASVLTTITMLGTAACTPDPARVTPSPSPAGILHQKGPYQAYYGPDGKIERLLKDVDGDGRADAVILYWPNGKIRAGEIDSDHDGTVDRWEYYSAEGVLEKVGTSRGKGARPDQWDIIDGNGRVVRREFDDDGDGKVDRSEPAQ